MTELILASRSPRRRELLERVGLVPFTVFVPQGEEAAPPGLPPERLVLALSAQKAEEAAAQTPPGALILAADTIVVLDGAVLGKPADDAAAAEMLRTLSGRRHTVYTGLTLRMDGRVLSEWESASVWLRRLTETEIADYVATGEPSDKAGAYGAQGIGSLLVERIEGDFFTVMGLPLHRLGRMLPAFGVNPLSPHGRRCGIEEKE